MRSVRHRCENSVAENRPSLGRDIEQIGAHGVALAILLVAMLREESHPEIGEQHADVEGHRAVEGEFRIDHPGFTVGDHDRAGMQIAVQQRLGIGREQMLQPLRLDLQITIGAQFGDDAVELRARMPVHLGVEIRVRENQVLGDVAEFDIVGEQRQIRLAILGRHMQVGAAKQGAGHEQADVVGDIRQLPPFDQRPPQDDVGRQILHDDQRLAFVEMIDRRHRARRSRLLPGQRVVFEEGALQRQRPAVADQADIGQGLLDDGSSRGAFDDEDQVEIAVADLADLPASRCPCRSANTAPRWRRGVPPSVSTDSASNGNFPVILTLPHRRSDHNGAMAAGPS